MKLAAEIRVDTSKLDAIRRQCPERAEAIVGEAARNIERRAKYVVAVDTGNLKDSIKAERLQPFLWWIHDGTDYGIYVEFGVDSHNMAAQPWLVPSVEAERAGFLKSWGDLLK